MNGSTEIDGAQNCQQSEAIEHRTENLKIPFRNKDNPKEEKMLEVVAGGTETQGQRGGSSLAAITPMTPVQSYHRIILPRRPGESRFAPQQYYYAASKSGVMPSLPLSVSGVFQHDESSAVQRDAA
jgi:hypothetical protein